jgi:hypothetical protein
MPLIKYNNQSLSSLTALPAAIPTGKLKLISSQTASDSASISFTTGLNSTYKVYKFVFVNISSATNNVNLVFNGSTDSGSNYNVTKTTTVFVAYHKEDGSDAVLEYGGNEDLAQSTAFQNISTNLKNDSDMGTSGSLTLFNPASTTYVKHFIARTNGMNQNTYSMDYNTAGYFNTTSAINAVRFQMSTGNIAAGTIYLYAIDNS